VTRVRCYYRYSSDEQTDGWSIEAQDKACRAFVAARPDWTITGSSRQTWLINRNGGLRLTSRATFCGLSSGAQACAKAG
jgi:hypothetical protein